MKHNHLNPNQFLELLSDMPAALYKGPKLNDYEEASPFVSYIEHASLILNLPMPDIYYVNPELLKRWSQHHISYINDVNALLIDSVQFGNTFSIKIASSAVFLLHCAYQERIEGRPKANIEDATKFVDNFNAFLLNTNW